MPSESFYVYILTNHGRTVLCTGVTNNLARRVWEHKQRLHDGFTTRYRVTDLVYYETFSDPSSTIAREKQIKGGPRNKKIQLINSTNPEWRDLYADLA